MNTFSLLKVHLLIILTDYFYLSEDLNAELLLVVDYFHSVVLGLSPLATGVNENQKWRKVRRGSLL